MSLFDVADDAGGQDGRQLGAALFGRHRGGMGGVQDDTARGHRHLSEESMPTTSSAPRPARRPAGMGSRARASIFYIRKALTEWSGQPDIVTMSGRQNAPSLRHQPQHSNSRWEQA